MRLEKVQWACITFSFWPIKARSIDEWSQLQAIPEYYINIWDNSKSQSMSSFDSNVITETKSSVPAVYPALWQSLHSLRGKLWMQSVTLSTSDEQPMDFKIPWIRIRLWTPYVGRLSVTSGYSAGASMVSCRVFRGHLATPRWRRRSRRTGWAHWGLHGALQNAQHGTIWSWRTCCNKQVQSPYVRKRR